MLKLKHSRWFFALLAATVFIFSARASQVSPATIVIAAGDPDPSLVTELTRVILQNFGASQVPTKAGILIVSLSTGSSSATFQDSTQQFAQAVQAACSQAGSGIESCSIETITLEEPDPLSDLAAIQWYPFSLAGVFVISDAAVIDPSSPVSIGLDQILNQARSQSAVIIGVGSAAELLTTPSIQVLTQPETLAGYLQFGTITTMPNSAALLHNVFVDPSFLQPGRLFRALGALALPESGSTAIGLPGSAAVEIQGTGPESQANNQLTAVLGSSPVIVLDAGVYHAANTVEYSLPGHLLSIRNVLVHVIPPGPASLDLETGQMVSDGEFPILQRNFDALSLPQGVGEILIAGDALFIPSSNSTSLLSENGEATLTHFVNLAGGSEARLLLLVGGSSSGAAIAQTINGYTQYLTSFPGVQLETRFFSTSAEPESIKDFDGILIVIDDPGAVAPGSLPDIRTAWMSGVPLLLNPAAASLLGGSFHSVQNSQIEGVFPDQVETLPGVGVLPFNTVPKVVDHNQWSALFFAAFAEPNLLAIGLSDTSAVELTSQGALVTGSDPLLVLDFRSAILGQAGDENISVQGGLLDIFTPGDFILPLAADPNEVPLRGPTPVLPSATYTNTPVPSTATLTATVAPSATATPTLPPTTTPRGWRPTRTPGPTATPPEIPPPPDASRINVLVALGTLIVGIVLLGLRWNIARR